MGALGPRSPVPGRAASSGEAGAGSRRGAGGCRGGGAAGRLTGLGGTEAAPLLLGGLSVGAAHPAVSASPAAAARRCGGRDTETETAAAGPASGLGLATAPRPAAPPRSPGPRPVPPGRLLRPPLRGSGLRLLTWAARTRGAGGGVERRTVLGGGPAAPPGDRL